MIVTIRGTHGSGKTTLVRKVMEKYECKPDYEGWRTRPIGYECTPREPGRSVLWIPGSYEAGCGGCDTISDINEAFETILDHAGKEWNVLYEGIVAQHSTWNVKELVLEEQLPFLAIILTTPVEDCIESVQYRRIEQGKEPLADTGNISKEHRSVELGGKRLEKMGVDVRYLDRDMALAVTLEALGWNS